MAFEMDPSGGEYPVHLAASTGPTTSDEPVASQELPVPDILLPHTEPGQPPIPNPSFPPPPPANMPLNIDAKLLETVNERRLQAKAKGALARARLRLQQPQNFAQSTPREEPTNPDDVDWAAEENALADEDSGK